MAIPNQTAEIHHLGDVEADFEMGIRAEDLPFLAEMLNSPYSNVIAAPVREYSTNAWDSHVDAQVTRPIEITLPTYDRLEFVVQDFGLGMSLADLRDTYAFYGASSKRASNAVAGQLGLGSKSGLSYTDAFTVEAVKDHERVVAMVTRNERGLGVIRPLVPPCATDQANGVRIVIPVDRGDVDTFREAAEHLFQFWAPGTVLVNGQPPARPAWLDTALALDADTHVIRKDGGLNRSYVIMGNVPYPVPDASVGRSSYRFVARLNIGDVEFPLSREEVKHTAKTDATLAELDDFIAARFKVALDKALGTATTRWDETVIRVLWAAKGLEIRGTRDNNIWSYNPAVNYGRPAQSHLSYNIVNLTKTSTVVITGYQAKNLSAVARDRLTERFGSKTFFVILPTGAKGTHLLDGRPNTFTWDEVVRTTSKPRASKGRAPKAETVYTVFSGPGMTAAQLAALTTPVLYANPGDSVRYGSLDATVVMLYSSAQLPRIQRLVPGVRFYTDEVTYRRRAASAAITTHDQAIVAARTLPPIFQHLDPDQVADPELAKAIRLSKEADTATITEANRFHVEITAADLPDFTARYPLASGGSYYSHADADMIAERLFYVNARYQANRLAAVQTALTQGAA